MQNHKSAVQPEVKGFIDNIILEELREGNYEIKDTKPIIVSAIGAVPKSDTEWRLIHDFSLPENASVNNYAPEFNHYSYESVDSAVRLMKHNYYAAKIDLRHAFRSVPISEDSQRATGLCWTFTGGKTVYMIDKRLPFGSSASPTIFHRLSQSIKRMMARRGHTGLVVYQDDFLVIGATYSECLDVFNQLFALLLELGFQINYNKLSMPSNKVLFLGLLINSSDCTLEVPESKLVDIKAHVAEFVKKKRVTKRQLQKLVGRLNFAAKAVRGARLFLRRLFNGIASLKRAHHKLRLSGEVYKDILWWHKFLRDFNGVAIFCDETPIVPVFTDACPVAGGGFCNGDIFYTVWEADYPNIADSCINYQEAAIAALSIQRWGKLFSGKTVYLYTDNICASYILNKCSCKNETLMQYMRDMFWVSAKYNFVVKFFHMAGFYQTIPDALSRLHENNGLLRVRGLINDWFLCHAHTENVFDKFSLLCHMSMKSLCYVLEQVLAWRKGYIPWTRKSAVTGKQPMPAVLSQHTSVN